MSIPTEKKWFGRCFVTQQLSHKGNSYNPQLAPGNTLTTEEQMEILISLLKHKIINIYRLKVFMRVFYREAGKIIKY